MPFRSLISRLRSTRKPRDREEDVHKEKDCEDENVEDLPTSSHQTEHTPQGSTKQLEANDGGAVKGLRKLSVSGRRSSNRRMAIRSTDVGPSDYLYFGEGTSAANVSQSLLNRSRGKSAEYTPEQPPTGTWNHLSSGGGKDQSGFLNTGLGTQTQQMGYSNLTFGGSLQYDYSAAQAPGFA
ncbi:hypothetical protein M434DRAFT_398781 [Hypoxylon sp. CO27-5]|nr:hypothetical protein M434DRAFT_398781 [Hypoxylon sp. CO27-5]